MGRGAISLLQGRASFTGREGEYWYLCPCMHFLVIIKYLNIYLSLVSSALECISAFGCACLCMCLCL